MAKEALVVFFSDLHSNSTVGLCPPEVSVEDGGKYHANLIQRWLWDQWTEFWTEVKSLRKKRPLVLVVVGDVIEGKHHGTVQLVSDSTLVQHEIALLNLEPAMDLKPDLTYFVRGTESHVGASAEFENFIAKEMNGVIDPITNSYTWSWLPLDIRGVLFNVAHHATGGRRPWTFANSANALAAEETITAAEAGERLPDVVVRAHKHIPKDSYDNYKVRVLGLPSWQLQTMYGTKLQAGKILPVGGYMFVCNKGGYELTKFIRKPKRRVPVRPEI